MKPRSLDNQLERPMGAPERFTVANRKARYETTEAGLRVKMNLIDMRQRPIRVWENRAQLLEATNGIPQYSGTFYTRISFFLHFLPLFPRFHKGQTIKAL